MHTSQPGILAPVPRHARYLSFAQLPGEDALDAVLELSPLVADGRLVVGIGRSLVFSLGRDLPGLRDFPAASGPGLEIPATPAALWCWLRGDDPGDMLHLSRQVEDILLPAFATEQVIEAFQYRDSRDLTGYVDGTENPQGDDAVAAGLVQGEGEGMDGSSFVAVQQWWHELDDFQAMPQEMQDHIIGRRLSDNEELDDAPESAHVKRTAQENFEPEAFILRRSMPWSDGMAAGLVFVAFGKTLDAFEAQLERMTGSEDGIVDGLFQFTRPLTGAYYWCPPVKGGRLDLHALGM